MIPVIDSGRALAWRFWERAKNARTVYWWRIPSSPKELHKWDDHTHLLIHIYQTTGITEKNDRHPEQNVARFIAQALEDAEYNYTIKFEFDPLDLPDDATPETKDRFEELSPDHTDVNLLIGDRWGGGLAGPIHGLVAGRDLDKPLQMRETAPHGPDGRVGFPYKHILNALHELGHILGGSHSDQMLDEPSLLWTESGKAGFDRPAARPENNHEDYTQPREDQNT